jgi:hypothetical protein
MRQLIVGTMFPAILLVTSCKDPKQYEEPVALASLPMTVEAQQVLKLPPPHSVNGRTMFGRFEIRLAKKNEMSVAPATTGGACLLAQIAGKDLSCSSNQQCDMTVNGKKWLGYCLRDQDSLSGDLATNHCWVRPGPAPALCQKDVGAGTHYTPSFDTTEAYQEARKHSRMPVKWMVYGCLNGPYEAGKPETKGCAGGPYPSMHDQGQIATVP